jgi:hypothetical protein
MVCERNPTSSSERSALLTSTQPAFAAMLLRRTTIELIQRQDTRNITSFPSSVVRLWSAHLLGATRCGACAVALRCYDRSGGKLRCEFDIEESINDYRAVTQFQELSRPQRLIPTAHQYGEASENLTSASPADAIISWICARLNRCSNRVPKRSNASVLIT